MVTSNRRPTALADGGDHLATLRASADQVTSDQNLVYLLVFEIGDDGFERGDVAVDIGQYGDSRHRSNEGRHLVQFFLGDPRYLGVVRRVADNQQ